MDLFPKIMELVDKNADKIPEGDYLELCGAIKALREQVKPPPFLLDQNVPLQLPSHVLNVSGDINLSGLHEEWSDTTIAEVSLSA
jgi:hypothetical protein